MANDDLKKELETLQADLAAVREDLGRLRSAGADAAEDTVASARQRLEEETDRLLARLKETADEAGTKGRRMLDDVESELEERPLTTLLSSFGIGVLIGWIFSRK